MRDGERGRCVPEEAKRPRGVPVQGQTKVVREERPGSGTGVNTRLATTEGNGLCPYVNEKKRYMYVVFRPGSAGPNRALARHRGPGQRGLWEISRATDYLGLADTSRRRHPADCLSL